MPSGSSLPKQFCNVKKFLPTGNLIAIFSVMISRLIVPLSVVLGVVLQFTLAVDVQATVWKTPDGTVKDLALTFTNSQTIPLVWNNVSMHGYIYSWPLLT